MNKIALHARKQAKDKIGRKIYLKRKGGGLVFVLVNQYPALSSVFKNVVDVLNLSIFLTVF